MAINVEELISPSEDENEEEEDEWRPEKNEKGRRISKKSKATGVRLCLELAMKLSLNCLSIVHCMN